MTQDARMGGEIENWRCGAPWTGSLISGNRGKGVIGSSYPYACTQKKNKSMPGRPRKGKREGLGGCFLSCREKLFIFKSPRKDDCGESGEKLGMRERGSIKESGLWFFV